MAVTLAEQLQAFDTSPALHTRVQAAMYVAAQAALVEVSTTPNHANRVILAQKILFAQNGAYTDAAMRIAIAANAGAANLAAVQNATDAQAQAAINAAYDAMANGL